MGGSRGRLSNTHGGAAIRPEEGEEGPTPGKDPAETVGSTTAMDPDPDPDSRVTEAATGGGAMEPLEARPQQALVSGPQSKLFYQFFFVLSSF